MNKRSFLFLLFPLILSLSCEEKSDPRSLRVGLYDNPPKVYRNLRGEPRGIFIETLEYMAERENWNIEYVYGEWNGLLERLAAGELDLMPDVAYTEERNRVLAFSKLPLLSSWLLVYSAETREILTQKDLDGLRVAVLSGSYQERFLQRLNGEEGYRIELLTLNDYGATVDAVSKGEADACVVDRFFEYTNDGRALTPSPLILAPSHLYFAAPRGSDPRVLAAVDRDISRLLNEDHAVYNRILSDNLHKYHDYYRRKIIMVSLAASAVIILLALVIITLLKRQIEIKARELYKQKEVMEQIHRMNILGQLSSEIAHDFNNILCGIFGYVELIGQINENEEIARMLGDVMEAGRRGEKIIGQILSFGKSGERERVAVKLSSLITEVTGLLRAGFPSSINITTAFPPGEPDLLLDTDRIHECLMNLCTNSLQSMGRDRGDLELILERKEIPFGRVGIVGALKAGTYLVLKIRDTGTGIPPEILNRIFEPYFSTKKQGEGTGLGLAVVFNVMKQHGGNIEIRSVPGVGTTFFLYFPVNP